MNGLCRFPSLSASQAFLSVLRRCCLVAAMVSCSVSCAQEEQLLFRTNWQDGLDPRFGVQANRGDLSIVDNPSDANTKALQATIRLAEDFSRVENGVPRAELLFPAPVRFAQGKTYHIRWSTMLPPGVQFDSRQLVVIMQINQGSWLGAPTVALALQGKQYAISQHGGAQHDTVSAGKWVHGAGADTGKWVHWELIYRPQDDGTNAVTQLRRDGELVFLAQGKSNAYPGVQNAYLKLGLYKPDWQKKATDVATVSVLYGPVTVSRE